MANVGPGPNAHQHTAISAALRQCRMFASLSTEDLAAVADGCAIRSLQKGETLFRQGEDSEGFYVMQSGAVSVFSLTPDGRERIISIFRPFESFAEATLAALETYPANAAALEPSQVILVSKRHFRELIRRQPDLSLQMLGSMSLHLKHLVQSLQDIKGRQIEYRLAEWLRAQTPAAATATADEPVDVELPMTKKVLAGRFGVTSETLSRTLARFRREGLIEVSGARIRIIDGRGLSAYAEL